MVGRDSDTDDLNAVSAPSEANTHSVSSLTQSRNDGGHHTNEMGASSVLRSSRVGLASITSKSLRVLKTKPLLLLRQRA